MRNILIATLMLASSVSVVLGDCPDGDIDGDCKVTIKDFAIVASEWLAEGMYNNFEYPNESEGKEDRAIHMSAIGVNQGEMAGSSENENRGSIAIIDYQHEVYVPTDIHTGLATGQRIHGALKVKKYIDKSSPLLLQALCTGEKLTTLELEFYRRNSDDSIEEYYTITLDNAIVISYETETPNIETFSFSYEKITWHWETNEDGTIEYTDDWKSPVIY